MIGIGRWLFKFSHLRLLIFIMYLLAFFSPKRLLNMVDINCRLRLLLSCQTSFLVKIELFVPIYSENVFEFSGNHFSYLEIKRFLGNVFFDDLSSLIDKVVAFQQLNDTQRIANLLLFGFQNVIAMFDHTYQKLLYPFLNPSLIHRASLPVFYYLIHSINQPLFLSLRRIRFLYFFGLAFPRPEESLFHYPFLKIRDSRLASLIRRCFLLEFRIMICKIFRSLDLSDQVIIFSLFRHELIKFRDRKDLAQEGGVSILAYFWRDESIVIMEYVL